MRQSASVVVGFVLCAAALPGGAAPAEFTNVRQLTNSEVSLTLLASTGLLHRVDASTNFIDWEAFVTFPKSLASSRQHTDSAAPFQPQRFYRASTFNATNVLDGDHLATTNGDVVIRPVNHATFLMQWQEKWIFNDPAHSSVANYPKPDLVLLSHSHGDHYQATILAGIATTNTTFIVPQSLFSSVDALPGRAIALTNGASTNVLGIGIEAVPAYNANHSRGSGNGYVLTIGGRRIYISGDTGNQPEIRALPEIDVAFVSMNVPFTMTPHDATNLVRAIDPRVVYPYHYRNQAGSTTTNAAYFKQILGVDSGIEVRLRNWY